jgi:hypothetical protein
MRHFIVCSPFWAQQLAKIQYFKLDLGKKHIYTERGKEPEVKFEEEFILEYTRKYRRLPHMNGHIGTIKIYIDYGMPMQEILISLEGRQQTFLYDSNLLLQSGSIDKYLGTLLKQLENIELITKKENIVVKSESYENLYKNPGSVSWEDIVAYKRRNFKK